MAIKLSDIEEYTEAIIEISEGLASDVLDIIGYDFDKRNAVILLLTCYSLILTYRKMEARDMGFFGKRRVVNRIVESMAVQNMMSPQNISRYKITLKFLLRLFGQLPESSNSPIGTLGWEYARYMIDQIDSDETDDVLKVQEVKEKLLEIDKNLKTSYLVDLVV